MTSITTIHEEVLRREKVLYDTGDAEYMKMEARDILEEIRELEDTKRSVVYENQRATAQKVAEGWCDLTKIITFVLAMTQSGKTGTILGLLKILYSSPSFDAPPLDNVFVITGLSDREWVKQTKERMPPLLRPRVFHRPALKKQFLPLIQDVKDAIIIIDEAQIACQKGQTLYKIFKEAGLLDIEQLTKRNIRIAMFTATPNGLKHEVKDWGEHQNTIVMDVPESYISPMKLLENNSIRQYKNISSYDEDLKSNLEFFREQFTQFDEPKYHLVRIPKGPVGGKTIINIQTALKGLEFELVRYYAMSKNAEKQEMKKNGKVLPYIGDNINQTLVKRPRKHTIILLKDRLRCAKTLVKKFIGMEYERYTDKVTDEVIIQGIRLTGYDCHKDSVVYTNIESIRSYEKMVESKFESEYVCWNSSTTKYLAREEKTVPTTTFLNVKHIAGLEPADDGEEEEN